jgi:5-methyltetrahydrofolate--homocysteine methyltransferase
MGSLIQRLGFEEEDYRGEAFANHPLPLKGAHDLLCITQPEAIQKLHEDYLEAGSDLVETNTFNATRISMADYGLEDHVFAINKAAAECASRAAGKHTALNPEKPRYVVGSMGPTNRTASLSPDVSRPGFRAVDFDDLRIAYKEQALGLLAGGADALMIETIFDTLNGKAAYVAIEEAFEEHGARVPIMVSGTITDASGRTLSGQTLAGFLTSFLHADLLTIGLNCALGAAQLRSHVQELSREAPFYVSAHPNAGLPNEFGQYDQTPEEMAELVTAYAREGWVNIIGGCCGSTPEHIRLIAQGVAGLPPRIIPDANPNPMLSGLERLEIFPGANFINIGERTNVTGSSRFAKLIREGSLDKALEVARQQVESGAQILDINMDEGLLDSEKAMVDYLNLLASEPDIARVPVMIDSSKWSVIEQGLKRVQGKGIVNSLSLKEGVEPFMKQAATVRRYGAAAVVMCFDEEGQADTLDRRTAIAERAYRLLVDEAGFLPQDIIIDPNIFAIGTGIAEHARYAIDFIEACRWIKANLPGARVSGGISNLSFSFRGNNHVREAMHSIFLYHAIPAGMDMGIVNAGGMPIYDEIEPELRTRIEDLIFDRRADATERLIEWASQATGPASGSRERDQKAQQEWRGLPVEERLQHALVHGVADHVVEDSMEALEVLGEPLLVIEGPLMAGMNRVGELFGAGKMFLPQVVKSARVMKKAVGYLEPLLAAGGTRKSAGKILLATVKGDVHDIGKNIVGAVLACNGYEIVDLGVMVPTAKILDQAEEVKADIIGLSGLITPSLDEMVAVASEMEKRRLNTPLLIGGATTSRIHTALKIDPAYSGAVVHVKDASLAVGVASKLLGERHVEFAESVKSEYQEARDARGDRPVEETEPIENCRAAAAPWTAWNPPAPQWIGPRVVVPDFDDIVSLIDWTPFFGSWELHGRYPAILTDPVVGVEATKLFADAQAMIERLRQDPRLRLQGVVAFYPAWSEGDDVVLRTGHDETARLPMLRQQKKRADKSSRVCLSDFFAPHEAGVEDWVGMFCVTGGSGLDEILLDWESREPDLYESIMAKAVCDRFAEAMAEWAHRETRRKWWGFAPDEALSPAELIAERFQGIRPAPGYPACPDHRLKRTMFDLMEPTEHIGVILTESCAMHPTASVSGLYVGHPSAKYFSVGRIGEDQVADYARRMGEAKEETEKWMQLYLAYKPGAKVATKA